MKRKASREFDCSQREDRMEFDAVWSESQILRQRPQNDLKCSQLSCFDNFRSPHPSPPKKKERTLFERFLFLVIVLLGFSPGKGQQFAVCVRGSRGRNLFLFTDLFLSVFSELSRSRSLGEQSLRRCVGRRAGRLPPPFFLPWRRRKVAQSTPDPLFLLGVGRGVVESAVFGSAPGFGDEIQCNGRMKREGVLGTVPIRRKRICTRGMRWLSWGEQQRISPPPPLFSP